MTDRLAERLAEISGRAHVLVEADMVAGYQVDWTGRWRGECRCVVRPGSTAEVAETLRACADAGVPITPQGGNTGLVGGAVPREGAVVLSTRRLDRIGSVDAPAAQVQVGAGATLGALQQTLAPTGLRFAVDLAARDSATLGGMAATNAGGHHVLRYGSMRAQVVGFEAVFVDGGAVRRMSGLVKDNAGYDLGSLLCGSEGTLAVITELCLRLVPRPRHRVTALVGLPSLDAALAVLAAARAAAPVEAAEIMFADGVALVTEMTGVASPLRAVHPCVLLLEAAGARDESEALSAAVGDAVKADADVAVGVDDAPRRRLWEVRERHTDALNALGPPPHKLDVSVPINRLVAFERRVREAITAAAPTATAVLWGHLGDGNLHVNVVGPDPGDDTVDEAILRCVAEHDGSISAEHGIGVAKAGWLGMTRSGADIAAMWAIKAALDPRGLLNPGVLFAST